MGETSLSKDPSWLAFQWERWEPDSNFLSDLRKWNKTHENDKLPAVLDKVNSILESKSLEAALEFIPDNPFPAKSLVKAIINLFLLGSVSESDCLFTDTCDLPYTQIHYISSAQKIPKAKQDIYNFSNQIVVDITNLAVVLDETGCGQLSQKAWEDLQMTRELVNEICEWAYNGLVSLAFRQSKGVVTDIHSKQVNLRITLTADKKMKELTEKLMDVRSRFMVRFLCLDKIIYMITNFPYQQIAMIRALGALDTVIDSIEDLRKYVGFFKIRFIPV